MGEHFAAADCYGVRIASDWPSFELDSMSVELDFVVALDCPLDCASATEVDLNAASWLEAEMEPKIAKYLSSMQG